MFSIFNGRTSFYQWDVDQKLIINCDIPDYQVHFENTSDEVCYTLEPYELDGKTVVNVPNVLLQKSAPITVWCYVLDKNGNYTIKSKTFAVIKRQKPSDYVYTETEVLSFNSKLDKNVGAENAGKALIVGEDGNIICDVITPNAAYKPYPVTLTKSNDKWTADHTFTEVQTALANGYTPYCIYEKNPMSLVEVKSSVLCYCGWYSNQIVRINQFNIKNLITVTTDNTYGVDLLNHLVDADGSFGELRKLLSKNRSLIVVNALGGTSNAVDLSDMTFPALIWGTGSFDYTTTPYLRQFAITGAHGDHWTVQEHLGQNDLQFTKSDVGEGSSLSNLPITYLKSEDKTNPQELCKVNAGIYILYGYFTPYSGSGRNITYDNRLAICDVNTKDGTRYFQIFSPYKNTVLYLVVTESTYERTDTELSGIVTKIDTTLSNSSTYPLQNKVITEALTNLENRIAALEGEKST